MLRWTLAALGLCGAFLLGHHTRPPDPRPGTSPDGGELLRSLDSLEASLVESRGWVEHQQDLRNRHEQVTALACESANVHARDTARILAEHRHRRVHPDEDSGDGISTASARPASLNGRRLAVAPAVARPASTHSP